MRDAHASVKALCARLTILTAATWLMLAGCGKDEPEPLTTITSMPTEKPPPAEGFETLTIPFLMQGPGIVGTAPDKHRFSADSRTVYFLWNDPHRLDSLNALHPEQAWDNWKSLEDEAGWYALDVATEAVTKLSPQEAHEKVPTQRVWNRDRTRCAEVRGGDLYLVDTANGETRRITATTERDQYVSMTPSGDTVYFSSGDRVFAVPWQGFPLHQIADLRLEDAPAETEPSAQRQFLIDQQKRLFKEFRGEKPEKEKYGPQPVYLGEGWTIDTLAVSPSGDFAAVGVSMKSPTGREPLVPHFVTESGYMETKETRAKVGDDPYKQQIRIVDLRGDSLLALGVDEGDVSDIIGWSPVADTLLARSITADFKYRTLYVLEPRAALRDGKVAQRPLDRFHDPAWVVGPQYEDVAGWLPDGGSIYFTSERDGFFHLYTSTLGGEQTQLTRGAFIVSEAHPSRDGSRWFLLSNEGDAASIRMWTMRADGGERRLVVEAGGKYDPKLAPDASVVAYIRSTVEAPPELYLYDMAGGETSGPLTRSTTELFRSYAWIRPETIMITASDGVRLPAHIFRPETFGASSNGAGVIFIHGAGYLQNVADKWAGYYREYMFNHFLAAQGYTVLNVDFRGSRGYGRAFRIPVHRHLGGRDLDDIIDSARHLVRAEGIGADKVGVYGGSYGGFLTIMALFKYPDVIRCGGAIRSVTDWAHYNHWYTSRILGVPAQDPEAYERSSPINFAEGFQGGLLMLHGLVDDNVLAADVLRLSQRLIDLGKDDWDLILYPLEPHGFKRAASWTDEYKRIHRLFEEKLLGRCE